MAFESSTYKSIFKWQMVVIFVLFVFLGSVGTMVYWKASELIDKNAELETIKAEKDKYTQRAMDAERDEAYLETLNAKLQDENKKSRKFEMEVKYTEKLQSDFAVEGSNPFNRQFKNLIKMVKAVVDTQSSFPEISKSSKVRIDTALAIGCVESGLDPSVIGETHHEVSAFQFLPEEVPRLMKKAKARGFDVSSDPKDIRTSVILMYIHLGEKMKDSNGDRSEGVRKFNGNWRDNPSYWLRFLKYYHMFGDIGVEENLFR